MCSGTLGHIARYHSKTSNNNKTLIVDLLHMILPYWVYIACYSLLFIVASLPLFMILMSLDYLLFVIICLDPLDLHIQILRLGTKWCLPQRTGPIFLSRLTSSSLIVPTLPFGSRDLHPLREHFVFLVVYRSFWTWVVIKDTCKVMLLIITCITLYLYLVSWHMNIPRFVLYSDTCCT